jgi:VanZ family protein
MTTIRAEAAVAPRAAHARAWRAALVVLLMATLVLALVPAPPARIDTGWDKLNHALAFATLAFCLCMSLPSPPRGRAWGLLGLLAYGGAIELLQRLTPNRKGEWGDLLADALGIALGAALGLALLRLRARRQARFAATQGSRAKA